MEKENDTDTVIRDLIYFDVAKAASILSQVEGGLVAEIEAAKEETSERRNIRRYDVKLFAPEFGGTDTESETIIERRKRHHEICTILENHLLTHQFAIDVNQSIDPTTIWSGQAHSQLSMYGYVKVTGWAYFEDYTRLQFILSRYNAMMEYVLRTQAEPQLQTLHERIDGLKTQIEETKDRNKKARARKQLEQEEQKIEQALAQQQLPDWQIKGLNNFIDTFLKGRFNISVFPFEEYLPFCFLAALKRECFLDTDIDNLIHAYGTRPNLRLTLLGLITCLPGPNDTQHDFSERVEHPNGITTEQLEIEKAFIPAFDALQDLEKSFRFSHFPNVTLYPIALYREIRPRPTPDT